MYIKLSILVFRFAFSLLLVRLNAFLNFLLACFFSVNCKKLALSKIAGLKDVNILNVLDI